MIKKKILALITIATLAFISMNPILHAKSISITKTIQIDKNNTEYIWNDSLKYQTQNTSLDLIEYSNDKLENLGDDSNDRNRWQSNLLKNDISYIKNDKDLENK